MLDGVVPVFVKSTKQLLETLLDSVGVGRALVEGVGEAGHGELLLLVDLGDDSLLVHGLELSLLGLGFLLEGLDSLLESLGHLLLEVFSCGRVLLAHVLVFLFKIGPVLHNLSDKEKSGIVFHVKKKRDSNVLKE